MADVASLVLSVATSLAPLTILPLQPGTLEFFAAHAFFWGLASWLICEHRRKAWESAGLKAGPPGLQDWVEDLPAWSFEATFIIDLCTEVPLLVCMLAKIWTTMEPIHNFATETLADIAINEGTNGTMVTDLYYGGTSTTALEHIIFACHAGYMVRDFILFRSYPLRAVALFIVHHIGAIILAWCGSFATFIPGMRLLALCALVLEIGSMTYCSWVIWRTRWLYFVAMLGSNVFYGLSIFYLFYHHEQQTWMLYTLYVMGLGFICGRTSIMVLELSKHPKKVD
eukprot:TRINITY_DN9799_c0_g1_i1.p1 TRINITY_DN9799_c0_g1~~TRINITY_DN9799_c0_g1_i1.p1  ORF type:complete len:307 (-),score=43.01 TRINITY_DN9799_c0_g1_i1:674-1522(-)